MCGHRNDILSPNADILQIAISKKITQKLDDINVMDFNNFYTITSIRSDNTDCIPL